MTQGDQRLQSIMMGGPQKTNGSPKKPWILIYGPTGSGKSALAMDLSLGLMAHGHGQFTNYLGQLLGEDYRGVGIVNCDSVAVYRGFDVGSAKPAKSARLQVPHYLLDVVDWNQPFDAEDYARAGRRIMEDLWSQACLPIVVGGTGLYLRALQGDRFDQGPSANQELRKKLAPFNSQELWEMLRGLNPKRAGEIHPHDRVRLIRAIEIAEAALIESLPAKNQGSLVLPKPLWVAALDPPRPVLHERIQRRTQQMMAEGLVDEVKSLLSQGVDPTAKPMQSIGYKQVVEVLLGKTSLKGLEERIMAATRQYAKRQCTWFKKIPRDHTYQDSSEFRWDHLAHHCLSLY